MFNPQFDERVVQAREKIVVDKGITPMFMQHLRPIEVFNSTVINTGPLNVHWNIINDKGVKNYLRNLCIKYTAQTQTAAGGAITTTSCSIPANPASALITQGKLMFNN